MSSRPLAQLIKVAHRLNIDARRGGPPLMALTDPKRTPDIAQLACRLPRGAVLVYRHFGASDRVAVAHALRRLCTARGLLFLIGADPVLAGRVKADGVHLPERMLNRPRPRFAVVTCAAHSRAALARAARLGADAALLSPIFPSKSPSAGPCLGPLRAGRLARNARLPVLALGGVDGDSAKRLIGRGFSGVAGIDAFADQGLSSAISKSRCRFRRPSRAGRFG